MLDLFSLRNISRNKKAEQAANKTPAAATTTTEKPLTNTSGTAKPKTDSIKQLKKQIAFGAEQGGGLGAMAGFLGIPFTKKKYGRPVAVDVLNQTIVEKGSTIKAPKNASMGGFNINPSAPKKTTPTSNSGIDAPAPDTGWRPSGINTAGGLMSAEMGVPLQQTIGVSKRKR